MKKFYAKKLIFDKMTALYRAFTEAFWDFAYEHVHEEVSCKKLLYSKMAAYLT